MKNEVITERKKSAKTLATVIYALYAGSFFVGVTAIVATRDAEKLTGVSHSEFSHIRNTQLRRFTLDRMITILGKLDEDVEVNVTFRPRQQGEERPQHLGGYHDSSSYPT